MPNKSILTYNKERRIPSLKERQYIIKSEINKFKTEEYYNLGDLNWFIKALLENQIVLISKEAYSKYKECLFNEKLSKKANKEELIQLMLEHKSQNIEIALKTNAKYVCWEHIVPSVVLYNHLIALDDESIDKAIEYIIQNYGYVCIVTKEENKKLNDAHLQQNMPINWKFGDNIFERYKQVGIEIM